MTSRFTPAPGTEPVAPRIRPAVGTAEADDRGGSDGSGAAGVLVVRLFEMEPSKVDRVLALADVVRDRLSAGAPNVGLASQISGGCSRVAVARFMPDLEIVAPFAYSEDEVRFLHAMQQGIGAVKSFWAARSQRRFLSAAEHAAGELVTSQRDLAWRVMRPLQLRGAQYAAVLSASVDPAHHEEMIEVAQALLDDAVRGLDGQSTVLVPVAGSLSQIALIIVSATVDAVGEDLRRLRAASAYERMVAHADASSLETTIWATDWPPTSPVN